MNDFTFIKNQTEFLKKRHLYTGASDLCILLGLSKYLTPYEKWRIDTGRDKPPEMTNPAKWGHLHEINILRSYIQDITNYEYSLKFTLDYLKNYKQRRKNYKPPTTFYPFTEFIHPEVKFAMAHPDCIDIENKINIEAKSGSLYANIRRSNMDGFDKNDNSESGVPLKYYIQCQWQMFCIGNRKTILRALIDTSDELTYNINYNQKITEKLIEVASRYRWHVKNDKEPMPLNSDDIKKLFPIINNKTAYLMGADSELAKEMIKRKKYLSEKEKKIKDEIKDINDSLFIYIGENKLLFSEDNKKLCSQVMFSYESTKELKEIKEKFKENKDGYNKIYQFLKDNDLIKNIEVRYVR